MPNCLKCQTYFPVKQVIEGKPRILSSRKYCLSCSPFGMHNTRRLDMSKPERVHTCRFCGTQYNAGQGQYAGKCKTCRATKFRQDLKRRAVAYLGGHCQLCGYANCLQGLQFHHRDPREKDFTIADYTKSWARVQEELDKCVLLCALCHVEVHAGLWDIHAFPPQAEVWKQRYNRL